MGGGVHLTSDSPFARLPTCIKEKRGGGRGVGLTIGGEGVDLPDGDDVRQHVAQPLRPHEVQLLEGRVVVVEQDAWICYFINFLLIAFLSSTSAPQQFLNIS